MGNFSADSRPGSTLGLAFWCLEGFGVGGWSNIMSLEARGWAGDTWGLESCLGTIPTAAVRVHKNGGFCGADLHQNRRWWAGFWPVGRP